MSELNIDSTSLSDDLPSVSDDNLPLVCVPKEHDWPDEGSTVMSVLSNHQDLGVTIVM